MIMRLLILPVILLITACATTPGNGNLSADSLATANKLYLQALSSYRSNQLMEAFQAASGSIEKNPVNARAYNLLGLINQRLDRNEAAATAFRRALKLTPDDPALLNNYGTFLCGQRAFGDAQQQYLRAARASNNPHPEIAYTNAGLCARRSGDMAQASQFFQQAIQHNPGQPTALYQLALISLEKQRPVEANTWLTQYLNHAVHTPKTLLLGARIEAALGNTAGIDSYVQKLRSAFPQSRELTTARALQQQAGQTATTTSARQTPSRPFGHDWIQQRDPTHFTLQIHASRNRSDAESTAGKLPSPTAIYASGRSSDAWYNVIHGDFATIDTARTALTRVANRFPDYQPWVREFGSIQTLLRQQSIAP
jgi:type IV pilus assembly protein PilF